MIERAKQHLFQVIASVLAVFALIGMLKSSDEPVLELLQETVVADLLQKWSTGNTIIFNLSIGYLVSLMFWIIVVGIPERKKRIILKKNLANHYQLFKEDVIRILLTAAADSHSIEYDLPKRLTDHIKFKEHFSINNNQNWYDALNGLQHDTQYLDDLIVEIEIFANEIAYILNKVDFDDPEVIAFFKRLSHHVYRLKNSSVYSYDQVKYLGNFLWGILTRWSFIDGQREDDIVELMIERL